jgi:hypothetical protein
MSARRWVCAVALALAMTPHGASAATPAPLDPRLFAFPGAFPNPASARSAGLALADRWLGDDPYDNPAARVKGTKERKGLYEFGGYRLTVRRMSPLLVVDLGPSGVPRVFELLPFRVEVGSTGRDGLQLGVKAFPLLHHVQHVILERRLTSGKCRDLMLQALELLGRQSSAGEPSLVARRPRSDAVYFGF